MSFPAPKLTQRIAAAGGALRFDRFMALALYDPEHGYYTTAPNVLGEAGDFTTASEMGGVYAATLARRIGAQLDALNEPLLIEYGGGSGAFAADLLEALGPERWPARYLICEVSPTLAVRQRARIEAQLPAFAPRLGHVAPHELPQGEAVLIANEVIDALPVRRFEVTSAGLQEHFVLATGAAGVRCEPRPVSRALAAALATHYGDLLDALPEGYLIDHNARMGALLGPMSRAVTRGALWFVDYGETRREYLFPERTEGTLVCHYRHAIERDPLKHVGAQDITAAVDFTRLAEVASCLGLTVASYLTQAHLLALCGFDDVVAAIEDETARFKALAALKTLLLPGQMGERMKAMVLTRDLPPELSSFPAFDMRHRL